MADIEKQPTVMDEHPTALIGRGDSVVVKEVPKGDAEDFESEIALIKESEVRHHSNSTFIPANSHHRQLSCTCTN